MKPIALVLSCEHAVNTVPPAYQKYFVGHEALLQTHRAMDFGALAICSYLSQFFGCGFIQAQTTRLLIDCNRSLSHPRCFSEISSSLPEEEKKIIIQRYYLSFRQEVEARITKYIEQGCQVWHLSLHSFTPVFKDIIRNAEIGLLYDPSRTNEKILAKRWQQQLKQCSALLRVRMNYPYRGISDGFTSALRKQFSDNNYAGLEIETNQALTNDKKSLVNLSEILATSLKELMTIPCTPSIASSTKF